MARTSFAQTDFRGGEWSATAQGKGDDPKYTTALNLCTNAFPMEASAVTRRPGERFAATTRFGAKGRVHDINFAQNQPWTLEFTDGYLRFYVGAGGLVLTPDAQGLVNISTATPAVVQTAKAHGWSTGNMVEFNSSDITRGVNLAPLRNRQFVITVIDAYHFSISDPITGAAIVGSGVTFDPTDATLQVGRVLELTTPYTAGNWAQINFVQTETNVILLHPTIPPYVLTPGFTPGSSLQPGFIGTFGIFTLAVWQPQDGPYLDPVPGSQATPSGLGPTVNITISYQTWSNGTTYNLGEFVTSAGSDYQSLINGNVGNTPASSPSDWALVGAGSAVGPNGFQAGDVTRLIRLFSEPLLWNSATGYATGAVVQYSNTYYSAEKANTGVEPDSDTTIWAPVTGTNVATWTWGIITAIISPSQVTVALIGPNLLYTSTIYTWRLGVYANTTAWPTNGTFHEGRLWLTGAVGNRVDGSMSDQEFFFSPTGPDGTVADNNAISAIAESDSVNQFFWMLPDHIGIVCGTQGGEWEIKASQLGDPLTPSSVQLHRVTKYGCANVPPVRTTLSVIMVQRHNRKVLEFVADVFSGRWAGKNLAEKAMHLTFDNIQEMAYQQEVNPTVWMRTTDGQLNGMTYKRESAFTSEGPTMNGWHRHDLGSGRDVESVTVGPSVDGTLDTLAMVTNLPTGSPFGGAQLNVRHVSFLSNLFEENNDIYAAAFMDDAVAPASASLTFAGLTPTGITFYGLWHLNGYSVAAFVAGIDTGQWTIVNGQIMIPFGVYGGVTLNAALLQQLSTSGESYGSLTVNVQEGVTYGSSLVTTPQTITSYIPTSEAGGATSILYPSWDAGIIFMTSTISGNQHITKFALGNQTQLADVQSTTLGLSGGFFGPGGLATDGNLYGLDNASKIWQITSALTAGHSVATAASSHSSPAGGPLVPQAMVPLVVNGNAYVVGANDVTGVREINVTNMTLAAFAGHYFSPDENCNAARMVATWKGINWGAVHTITGSTSDTTVAGLYVTTITAGATDWNSATWPTQNPAISTRKIGTITPAQIDATWTHFHLSTVPIYDQTDDNLLVFFNTDDAVTHQNYLTKINAQTGVVMWTLALAAPYTVASNSQYSWGQSRIQAGTFSFMPDNAGTTTTLYIINTITGVVETSTPIAGVAPVLGLSFDDKTGVLLYQGNFTNAATGHPTQVGSTPNSFTSQWAQLVIGTAFQGIATATNWSFPTGIGFSFETDIQLLRPFHPQVAGTQLGPAFAKNRRIDEFGLYCVNTQGVQIGTDFNTMHQITFTTPGGTPYPVNQLFTGTWFDNLNASDDFDNMIAIKITRPYPATFGTIGGFITTKDRE